MISVAEALQRITATLPPLPAEQVNVGDAFGRVLAEDILARRNQPPAAVSAMDGYAVRASDVAQVPVTLAIIGQAPAGAAFEGALEAGQTVRIFTGAPVPEGADAIVIQENTEPDGDRVTVKSSVPEGHYIRPAGLDFKKGEILMTAGRTLSARDVGLCAAMDVPWLKVTRKPRIAILATGDEIVMPGDPIGRHQIVSSNSLSLAAFIKNAGGVPIDLGIALDTPESLKAMAAGARGADMLITCGGASVGDHDLVQAVLGQEGLEIDFWQIAMRPGKPLMFGRIDSTPVLGLPGNPVSSLVCAVIFLGPAIARLLGVIAGETTPATAILGADVGQNDERQDYLRARLSHGVNGALIATPFEKQDSSMMATLAKADCLIVRPPFAAPAKEGTAAEVIPLSGGFPGV